MNTGTLDMLSASALADVVADVSRLLTDPQIGGVPCTYRARGTHGYNPATGIASDTETTTAITATITPLTEREIAASYGARRGDVQILIASGQLASVPRVDDTVARTSDGRRYHVLDVERYGMGTHYALTGREA